jgi:CheY-like chemotaxis protein
VEVIDTGVGMSPEVQRRALEPLYTTKPIGTGTGLGLSVCSNILDMWGGHLALESRIGEGTTVRLTFPASRLTAPPEEPRAEPEKTPPAAQAQTKTRILLIDDDHTVAKVVARMLRGYDVSVAHSGEEGIALLDSLGEVDVILCDLMMPGLSGVDVYERIAESRPGTERRIVFLTGGAFDPRAQALLERPDVQWLEKPMSPADLRRMVEDVCEKDA